MVYLYYVGWITDMARGTQRSSFVALHPGAWIPAGSTAGTQPLWLAASSGPVPSPVRHVDVLVIGAGQAGLATAHELHRSGLRGYTDGRAPAGRYAVLDAEVRPGGAWQHRWPTLSMETVNGVSDLPGMAMKETDPSTMAAVAVSEYFTAYEDHFDFPIFRPVLVTSVGDHEGGYRVETTAGTWLARAVVNATGTWTRPFVPYYPGITSFAGIQLHSQDYRGPSIFTRRRVAVVGGGISATQHIAEIYPHAFKVAWFTRREPDWVDSGGVLLDGMHVEASVRDRVERGLPPRSVVSETGLIVTDSIREAYRAGVYKRRPMFTEITKAGVIEADGTEWVADFIIWATGFRAELRHLAPLRLRNRAGGITMVGTAVASRPTLHLLGYGPTASTTGARWGARRAVRQLKKELGIH